MINQSQAPKVIEVRWTPQAVHELQTIYDFIGATRREVHFQPTARSAPAQKRSRKARFSTLPDPLSGKSVSENST
ncbi:MAG: hypothetical protein QOH70_4160 [Blastocatellia bacterium]|jgi:hypothetical protein|nr:hypothetical protein [Blastocatellia bacterium]